MLLYKKCDKCGKTVQSNGLTASIINERCPSGGLHSFSTYFPAHLKLLNIVKRATAGIAGIVLIFILIKNFIVWFVREYPVQFIIVISAVVVLIVILIIIKIRKNKRR